MEVLLDGVQGTLQDSALLGGQAALTLLRDVLVKKKKIVYIMTENSNNFYCGCLHF